MKLFAGSLKISYLGLNVGELVSCLLSFLLCLLQMRGECLIETRSHLRRLLLEKSVFLHAGLKIGLQLNKGPSFLIRGILGGRGNNSVMLSFAEVL